MALLRTLKARSTFEANLEWKNLSKAAGESLQCTGVRKLLPFSIFYVLLSLARLPKCHSVFSLALDHSYTSRKITSPASLLKVTLKTSSVS